MSAADVSQVPGRVSARAMPLFARPEFQAVAGAALRPGGLELTRRALELCPLRPGAAVLDLGCGRGATAAFLAGRGHGVLALDPSAEFLAGIAAPGVLPVLGRAEGLPLAGGSVDAVFCECVLSVSGAADALLAEVCRVLRPGGLLALSDLYLRGGAGLPPGGGDCLSGAIPQNALVGLVQGAGLAIGHFEDHSRLLAELAGRLIFAGVSFAGMSPAALGGGPRPESRPEFRPGCQPGARPGYFLCLARKPAT